MPELIGTLVLVNHINTLGKLVDFFSPIPSKITKFKNGMEKREKFNVINIFNFIMHITMNKISNG